MSSAAQTLPPIHGFTVGPHVDSAGRAKDWTAADLAELAETYDPKLSEAPVVIGHPKDNAPAYGWIGEVRTDGKQLEAVPSSVQPEFADWVGRKLYKKVSLSIYGRGHPNNPTPGKLYLRHVAFLGAQPPAIKGLRDWAFADGDGELLSVEFGDWSDRSVASLFRGLRDYLISKFGLEDANKALPDWQVQALAEEAVREETPPTQAGGLSYSEGDPMSDKTAAELAAKQAELDERERKLREGEAALAKSKSDAEHQARMAQFSEFMDGLVKEGRLLPRQKARLVAVMGALPAAEVLEFSEGDTLVKHPAVDALQGFLKDLQPIVDFKERAGDRKGAPVDTEDANAIHAAAVEFQEAEAKAGREVSMAQAVQHVTRQAA